MKNIVLIAIVILVMPVWLFAHSAELPEPKLFDLQNIEAAEIPSVENLSIFTFKISGMNNDSGIASWKIRTTCEEGIDLWIPEGIIENNCNEVISFVNFLNQDIFFVVFRNNNKEDKPVKFSLKLKAYDSHGDWLHTETERFTWR